MYIAHTRDSAIEILKSNYIELLIIATTGPTGTPYPALEAGLGWDDAVEVARAARDIASELDTVVAAIGLPTATSDPELPNAPFDYFMPRVSHPHQLRVRVDVILRLLTMQRELRRRIMVAAPFRMGEGPEKLLSLDARPSPALRARASSTSIWRGSRNWMSSRRWRASAMSCAIRIPAWRRTISGACAPICACCARTAMMATPLNSCLACATSRACSICRRS
ncbi:hypothetical protein E6W36_01095 [Hankyongella ginsenosidimutans]|uniref:Uncharacterized protein n=1 Tax=Hankyongella ginsenosidimutans TaxID=1763828 RepID=A0A4D7C108_9SPHN|nr:hypothetical protein [Hankyongella ginsenosidimutans]QCI78731.1 hypothetical protein E6W36_01095 [Hankyongella ginsenosidimutans]